MRKLRYVRSAEQMIGIFFGYNDSSILLLPISEISSLLSHCQWLNVRPGLKSGDRFSGDAAHINLGCLFSVILISARVGDINYI